MVDYSVNMKSLIVVLFVIGSALSASVPPHKVHPAFAKWNKNAKIIGGEEAKPHSIPHQVALFLDGYFCGASLISKRWVLTAAHCGELTNKPTVVLGAHAVDDDEPTQVILNGKKPIVHKNWDGETLENDIALIELPSDAPINDNINTVQLAPEDIGTLEKTDATASGWGLDSDDASDISPVLRVVTAPLITNKKCQNEFGWEVYDSVICMDGSAIKSTCSGDSGGPLTVVQNKTIVQVGLTSYGTSLGCEKGYPSAFTRISSFRKWITNNSQV